MRHAVALILYLVSLHASAQYFYVSSTESFRVINSTDSSQKTHTWLNLEEVDVAELQLADGTILKRSFPTHVNSPFYAVEQSKVWYRPNLTLAKADTVTCFAIVSQADQSDTRSYSDESDQDEFSLWVAEIKALEFEYEKSEKVASMLEGKTNFSCNQLNELLNCLQYPQSKANILAKHKAKFQPECFAEIANTLPKELQKSLLQE